MKYFYLLLFLSFSILLNAQNYNFGKVSKEELEEKFNLLDSSCSATYLYKYRRTYFEYRQGSGFKLVTDVHERIKIYNQEGFDYATKKLRLYKENSDREEFGGLKAYTYNLVDSKIEESKLKNDGVFKTELSENFNETKFTMPNVKEGCVIEYKYTINSPFLSKVDVFEFQHEIPIRKVEASFNAPEYFNFKTNQKGYIFLNAKSETKSDKIIFTDKTRNDIGSVTRTSFSTSAVNFNTFITKYDLTNVPALKEEPYVNSMNNYRSAVSYELSYTKFPNSPMEFYSTTWEDVVKKIYENPYFGSELNKTSYFEDDIDNLIGSVSDPITRIMLIYEFVKNRVKWNDYYGKYTSDGVRRAYKDHVGNVAEINLMLTSMLRYAKLDANPVLVSTRKNGVPLFPTRQGYDYVISGVKIPDKGVVLLDASDKYATPNILPFRILNWEGRIIEKSGNSSTINLYPKENSKNTITMMVSLDEKGDIEGNYRGVKTNHNALSYREDFNGVDQNDFLEKLENKYDGLEISDFKVTNALDLSKPVMESYKFFRESQADIIGDKIYFSPLFHLRTLTNPFKLEKREFPVDFGYSSTTTYRIYINLPEGYKVEIVPEPVLISLPDNLGSFKFNISYKDSKIQLLVESQINSSIIPSTYYDALKEYFRQFIEKENEQIVLTKI